MSTMGDKPWWSIAPTPSEPPEFPDDDWLEEIEEEIWNSGVMLAEAITDADSKLTIEAAIRLHAEKIRENRRERGY